VRLLPFYILFIFFLFTFSGRTQLAKVQGQGTLFFDWGYAKYAYLPSKLIYTTGVDQTITYSNLRAQDQATDPADALSPSKAFTTQFHAQFGYYFKNKYAVSLSIEQLKYALGGEKLPFVYDQLKGILYPRINFSRTDRWSGSYNQRWTLLMHYTIGAGPLFSSTNFQVNGSTNPSTFSISGLGLTLQAAPRFVWRQRFYLAPTLVLSYLHQSRVAISASIDEFMSQKAGVLGIQMVGGFYLHKRKSGGCMSCPEW
jgi:hypothetical protein